MLIHYVGWSTDFDEWIDINSDRLAECGTHVIDKDCKWEADNQTYRQYSMMLIFLIVVVLLACIYDFMTRVNSLTSCDVLDRNANSTCIITAERFFSLNRTTSLAPV